MSPPAFVNLEAMAESILSDGAADPPQAPHDATKTLKCRNSEEDIDWLALSSIFAVQKMEFLRIGSDNATAPASLQETVANAVDNEDSSGSSEPTPQLASPVTSQASSSSSVASRLELKVYKEEKGDTLLQYLEALAFGEETKYLLVHAGRKIIVARSKGTKPLADAAAPNDSLPTTVMGDVQEASTQLEGRRQGKSSAGYAVKSSLASVKVRTSCSRCSTEGQLALAPQGTEKDEKRVEEYPLRAFSITLGAFLRMLLCPHPQLLHSLPQQDQHPLGDAFHIEFSVAVRRPLAHDSSPAGVIAAITTTEQCKISFEVCAIPIFHLDEPRTRDKMSPLRRMASPQGLQQAKTELRVDMMSLHAATVQLIADEKTDSDVSGDVVTRQSHCTQTAVVSERDGDMASSVDATSVLQAAEIESSGTQPSSGFIMLLQIQKKLADLISELDTKVTSFADVDNIRWNVLRPLLSQFAKARASSSGGALTPPQSVALTNPNELFSPADVFSVSLSKPMSLIALALTRTRRSMTGADGCTEEGSHGTPGAPAAWREGALSALRTSLPLPTGRDPFETATPVTKHHIRNLLTVTEQLASSAVVEVVFPDHFAALQRLATGSNVGGLLDSLRASTALTTDGGKTNSAFFITSDGRYLLKQVKPIELRHFSSWANNYFAHMAKHFDNNDDTVSFLAKILGLFIVQTFPARRPQGTAAAVASPSDGYVTASSPLTPTPSIRFDGTVTPSEGTTAAGIVGSSSPASPSPEGPVVSFVGAERQYYVLMENTTNRWTPTLATGRAVDSPHQQQYPTVIAAFDLKGSQRSRTARQGSSVRLDTDFVDQTLRQGNFFFCTDAAKRLLMTSLQRDARLLRSAGVMDYSLFVSVARVTTPGEGHVDESVFQVVPSVGLLLSVGVIDYLHPFTGAKMLESKMKSGLDTVLGYTGRDPTIVDPTAYMERFIKWLNWYFCAVPCAVPLPLSSPDCP